MGSAVTRASRRIYLILVLFTVPVLAEADSVAKLIVNLPDASTTCFNDNRQFTVTFPHPMNNGDTLAIYHDNWRAMNVTLAADLGIRQIKARMRANFNTTIRFVATIDGQEYRYDRVWKPLSTLAWSPITGSGQIGRVRKKSFGEKIRFMIQNDMGLNTYVEYVSIQTPKGSISIQLSPLISANPFMEFVGSSRIPENQIRVAPKISTKPYIHAWDYVQKYREYLVGMRGKAQIKGCKHVPGHIDYVIQRIDQLTGRKAERTPEKEKATPHPDKNKAKPSGPPALYKQKLVSFSPVGSYDIKSSAQRNKFHELVQKLNRDGHKKLECVYGPSESNGTGFRTRYFWYKRVPLTNNEFRLLPGYPAWRNMGRTALDKCPSDDNEAERIRQANWNAWR